jgi:hypothetical protein
LPTADLGNSQGAGANVQSEPKQPSLTALKSQLAGIKKNLQQELSDEKAANGQLQALSESTHISLQAELNRTQTLIALHNVANVLCEARKASMESAVHSVDLALLKSEDLRLGRSTQSAKTSSAVGDFTATANEGLASSQSIRSKLQREMDTPTFARGTGITFDKFVLHPPNAQKSLSKLMELTAHMENLLRAKIDHDHLSESRMKAILSCPECIDSVNAVRDVQVEIRSDLAKILCADGSEEALLHDALVNVQQQIRQADDNDAIQRHEAEARRLATNQELERVSGVLERTG